jgi:hypothetical protein
MVSKLDLKVSGDPTRHLTKEFLQDLPNPEQL